MIQLLFMVRDCFKQSGGGVLWEGCSLPVLHRSRGIKDSCCISVLCRPQAVSLVIWKAATHPMCGCSFSSIRDILALAVLVNMMIRNIFSTNVLWENTELIPCQLCNWSDQCFPACAYSNSNGTTEVFTFVMSSVCPTRCFFQVAGDNASRYIQSYCLQRTHFPSAHVQLPTR